MRTQAQFYWDMSAILSLFDVTNQTAKIEGNLKIQKLAFIYELKGKERGLKSAHYRFFRYNLGPYSRFLANDVKLLKEKRFISRDNKLTERGKFLLELIRLNAPDFLRDTSDLVSEVARQYGKHTGPKLVNIVYKMEVPVIELANNRMRVKDIQPHIDILDPIKDEQTEEVALFPEDLLEDLKEEFEIPATRLDPQNRSVRTEALHAVEKALEDVA